MPQPSTTYRNWVIFATLVIASHGVFATALPAWDMEMLTRASDLVVRGTVASQSQAELGGRLVTNTQIDVDQVLYRNQKRIADAPGPSLVVTQWGGHSRTVSTRVGGDATLKSGQSVLLFLFRAPIELEARRPPPAKGTPSAPLLFITQLGIGAFTVSNTGDFVQRVDADLISVIDGSVQPRPALRRFTLEDAVAQISAGQHPPGEAPAGDAEPTPPPQDERSDVVLLPLDEIERAQAEASTPTKKKPDAPIVPPLPPSVSPSP